MPLPTPAIVAQSAVRRLPRWVILLLCTTYILTGFVARHPWREREMEAFALMQALAQGHSPWLMPQIDGLLPNQPGLLQYWLGAWALQLLPAGWPADIVTRLPFMLLLALALACTWWAVYGLARTPGAQPVAFAFGGEANPRDYAHALADGALLALLACLGLAQLGHSTTYALVQLAAVCALFYAASNLWWQPRCAAVATLLAPLALALSGEPAMAMVLGVLAMVMVLRAPSPRLPQRYTWAAWWLLSLALAASTAAVLHLWQWPLLPWGSGRDWDSLARALLWFSWPAWPLALWTLWRWRLQLRQPLRQLHLTIPLGLWVVALLFATFGLERDSAVLLTLPAIAAMAAFALPTLRRSLSALIDWLTLVFFTISAITIWVVWLSVQTGWPAKPAANVLRLSDGYLPPFEALPFAIALAASAAWLLLVTWRTRRHRAAIWKSLALPAGGSVLGWVLLMTLWLPMLDYGRSYAPQIQRLQAVLPASATCLGTWDLDSATVGALRWHTDRHILPWHAAPTDKQAPACPWLLTTPQAWSTLGAAQPLLHWQSHADIVRPTQRNDRWLLLHHQP